MIYLYFAGVIITFVIICSLINKEGWAKEGWATDKIEAAMINGFMSFSAFAVSFFWPLALGILVLTFIAKKVGQIDIKFNFKNEEPYDD